MSDNTSIEWTNATWNPVTGCEKVSPGCDHCLDPETFVLYEDFTWRRLGDVQVGDVLIGFDENEPTEGRERKLKKTVVNAVWRTCKPAMRVTTDKAEVICSGDHRFLAHGFSRWLYAKNFSLGTQLRTIGCFPAQINNDQYASGYLMGMTDGDGTWRFTPGQRSDKKGFPQCYWRVALADEEGLYAVQCHLSRFGLVADIRPFSVNNGHGYRKSMQRIEIRSISSLAALDQVLEYQENADFGSGYLAGIFDAEGSFHRNIRIANKNRSYLDRVVAYAELIGLSFKIEPKRPNEVMNARLYGGLPDKIAFFTLTQPTIKRKTEAFLGTSVDAEAAAVTKLELLGERELIDIETTTHTFFANGLATHNCYALTFAERFRGVPNHPYEQGFDLKLWPDRLELPLKWKKPRRIFVNSMSDLFHKDVPDSFILEVFNTMIRADQHIYQVLTKRPSRLVNTRLTEKIIKNIQHLTGSSSWPSHIWLGVSVETSSYAWRVDALRKIPASIRFISAEPLLGPLDGLCLEGIHWLISGGESGPGCRPCDPQWVRSLRDRCQEAGVAFFHKQWGGRTPKAGGRVLDGRTWDEFPQAPLVASLS